MPPDNVLTFPVPDPDLSSEQLAAEIANLTRELAAALSGNEPGGLSEQLTRIEDVTVLLEGMSQLVSRGRDRLRAHETSQRIMHAIAQLRGTPDPTL